MTEEKTSNYCSKSSNCYAIIALCISFLAIGMLLGNWMGKCTNSTKYYNTKEFGTQVQDFEVKVKTEYQKDSIKK